MKEYSLGELLIVNAKSKLKVRDASSEGRYPFFTSGVNTRRFDEALCDGENIFISTGGKANFEYHRGKASYSTDCLSVKVRTDVNARFIYYFLIYKSEFIDSRLFEGAALKHLQKDKFFSLPVKLPALDEQNNLVKIWDSLFSDSKKIASLSIENIKNTEFLFKTLLRKEFLTKKPQYTKTTVGDQLTLQRGFDITKKQQISGSVPVVSSGGIKSFHNEEKVLGPGVVVGRKGSIGSTYYIEDNFWPHDTTLWITDFKANNRKLAYYLLSSLDLKSLDTGAANPALNRNLVHPLEIFWPDIEIQQDLVDKLDILEQKTGELTKLYKCKLNKTKQFKKAILKMHFQ